MQHAIATPSRTTEGALLVFGSAFVWSFGGTIARYITVGDSWTVVFWRSLFGALFLLGFLVWRDGIAGTAKLIGSMRWPGYLVGLCFSVASISFIVALQYTTVAKILLVQAGVPLLAALISRIVFHEKVSSETWAAIAAVIAGITIMVSESLDGNVSLIGNGLALLIAVMFATATVTTRRHAGVRMTPAVLFGTVIACLAGLAMAGHYRVTPSDLAWLVAFGVLNLGLGLALFATGARMIPAALAALIGTMEPVLGPVWVWLFHNEVPSLRTLTGGGIVFLALLVHIGREWMTQRATS